MRDDDALQPKERLQWDARNKASPLSAPAAAALSSMRSTKTSKSTFRALELALVDLLPLGRHQHQHRGRDAREVLPAACLVDVATRHVANIEHLDGVLAKLRHPPLHGGAPRPPPPRTPPGTAGLPPAGTGSTGWT